MTLRQFWLCGCAVDLILCHTAVSSSNHRWTHTHVCMAGRLWSQYSILLLLDFLAGVALPLRVFSLQKHKKDWSPKRLDVGSLKAENELNYWIMQQSFFIVYIKISFSPHTLFIRSFINRNTVEFSNLSAQKGWLPKLAVILGTGFYTSNLM